MKVKLRDIFEAQAGLSALMQTNQPPGTAFYFVDLAQATSPKVENFNKHRIAWIEELGEAPDRQKDKAVLQTSPNWPEFQKRFNEMMDTDVDLPGVEPISRDKLGKSELKPAWIHAMGVFIVSPKATPTVDG